MPGFTVHAVTGPDDLEQVRALFLEYARSLAFSLCFQAFDAELAGLPGGYAPPSGALLLAHCGGEAAGCVGLRPVDARRGEMKRLYVRPAFRGDGLGRRLACESIRAAQQVGYAHVVLETITSMHAARALYESLGFRRTEKYSDNPLPGLVYYELDLVPTPIRSSATASV